MKMYLLLFGMAAAALLPNVAGAELVSALTANNQLLTFDSATPGTTTAVSITGLTAGDVLTGIDRRPANGVIYGLGINGTTGRLYSINSATGAASVSSTLNTNAMNTSVTGNFFGVDFNPTVDRLRIVSDTGLNLRANVETGVTIVDGNLNFAAVDANTGVAPQIVAAAYSNNIATAMTTTLFGLDLATQSLVTQNPPNAGTLNTVAAFGSIIFPESRFDISGLTGIAYAVLNGFELAQVDLLTGATTSLGFINTNSTILDLAAPTAVPEPSSALLTVLAVGTGYCIRRRQKRATAAIANSQQP